MSRLMLLCATGLACSIILTGCSDSADTAADPVAPDAQVTAAVPLDGYDAMAIESATAIVAAETAVRALDDTAGDLSPEQREALKADQRLIAYLVRAELDGQVALFEVRFDGIAHNIHSYPRAFDSGSIIWTPVGDDKTVGADAQSDGEKRSVAAVAEAMQDAFPDTSLTISLGGYRFVFLADATNPATIEIASDGKTVISVSR